MDIRLNKLIHNIQSNILKYRFLKFSKDQELHNVLYKFQNIIFTMTEMRRTIGDELETRQIDGQYDRLIKEMMNKANVKTINKFINLFHRWRKIFDQSTNDVSTEITGKKFLSMYIIYAFPEYIISKRYEDLEKKYTMSGNDIYESIENKLYNSAKRLAKYMDYILNGKNINRFTFYKLVQDYNNNFNEFMRIDKINKINELLKQFNDVELTISEINVSKKYNIYDKEIIIKTLRQSQEKTKKQFKLIDVNFDYSILDNYCKLYDIISKTYQQVYWDTMVLNLINLDYDMFNEILSEIKINLIKIAPTMKNQFDDVIDIDIIKSQLNDDTYTINDFLFLANFIVDRIIYLQASFRNKETHYKWNGLKEIMDSNMKEDSNYLSQCIANSLKFIYDQIEDIKNDINDFVIKALTIN